MTTDVTTFAAKLFCSVCKLSSSADQIANGETNRCSHMVLRIVCCTVVNMTFCLRLSGSIVSLKLKQSTRQTILLSMHSGFCSEFFNARFSVMILNENLQEVGFKISPELKKTGKLMQRLWGKIYYIIIYIYSIVSSLSEIKWYNSVCYKSFRNM